MSKTSRLPHIDPIVAVTLLGCTFVAACATSTDQSLIDDRSLAETCARFETDPNDGETVVVMRDQSSQTRGGAVIPAGPGFLEGGAAVVGPVLVTPDVTAGAYKGNQTRVEMRPCTPVDTRPQTDR